MIKSKRPVPHLLSMHDLAERLCVSTKTISRWIKAEELPAHRLGRQLRISEEDAAAFIAARRR